MPPVYEHDVASSVAVEAQVAVADLYERDVASYMEVGDQAVVFRLYGELLDDNVAFADTAVIAAVACLVQDRLGLSAAAPTNATYNLLIAQALRLRDESRPGRTMLLQDSLTFADDVAPFDSLVIIDRLGLADVLTGPRLRSVAVADALRIRIEVLRFFGVSASSALSLAAALTEDARHLPFVQDSLALDDATTSRLVLRLRLEDAVRLSGQDLLQAIYTETLRAGIELEALFVSPAGVATFAINTRTGAVTEYQRYDFTSFARLGRRSIATSSTGLYELVGDDDAGDPIIARLKGGAMQFGGTRLSGMRAAYLGINGEGEFFFRLTAGTGETYLYRVTARPRENTKVWLGKGLRHRYMTFELTSVGQDFDLDTIEFIPMRPMRRI